MKEISGVNGKIIIYLSILIYVLYVDMTPDPYSHQGVILLAHFNNDCRMINNIYFKLAPVIVNPILETVIGTEGSTPQKPGSSAIFNNRGLVTGSLGGRVAEARTQEFALK